MSLVYIGLYTLVLAFVWGFFIVLKIHAYKFKNFSANITKVTTILFTFLILLSFLGYFFIIFGSDFTKNNSVDLGDPKTIDYSEVDY